MAGAAPTLRVHGHLVALDYPPLDGEQTKALAYSLINADQRERFESNHELDFSYGVVGLSRYRVNVYRQRGAVGVAIRSIPHQPKSFQELGLPGEVCTSIIQKHKGLVLVTGPTGHGKTTTMAAIRKKCRRNKTRPASVRRLRGATICYTSDASLTGATPTKNRNFPDHVGRYRTAADLTRRNRARVDRGPARSPARPGA